MEPHPEQTRRFRKPLAPVVGGWVHRNALVVAKSWA